MRSRRSAERPNTPRMCAVPHPGHSGPSGYAILTTAASYMPTAWANGCVPTTLRVRPASLNLTATAVRSSYTTPRDAARPPWEDPPALAVAHGSPLRARGTIASGNQRPVSPPLGGMRDPDDVYDRQLWIVLAALGVGPFWYSPTTSSAQMQHCPPGSRRSHPTGAIRCREFLGDLAPARPARR